MRKTILALIASLLLAGPAVAQTDPPVDVAFAGGTLTIAESDEMEKVLTFNGKELARGFVLFYNRMVQVSDRDVALFEVGDGGNACSTASIIVWKPENGDVQAVVAGDDCGSPPPAVTTSNIYYVPYMLPGDSRPVQVWSPEEGMRIAGSLSFAPQPGTTWQDLDPAKLQNIVDAFGNADVYAAAQYLLGADLTQLATGLLVGGGAEVLPSGIFWSSGCVPHACGSFDAFMAVDAKGRKLYFAQQQDQGDTRTWPALRKWPKDVAAAARGAIPMPQ